MQICVGEQVPERGHRALARDNGLLQLFIRAARLKNRVTEITRCVDPFGRDSAFAVGAMATPAKRPKGLLCTLRGLVRPASVALTGSDRAQQHEQADSA